MRPLAAALWLMLGTVAALAEPLDTAEAFEGYVAGKTLFFDRGDGGEPSSETYLRDRRVRWSDVEGDCIEGNWYVKDGLVCFIYDNNPDPQCWATEMTVGGLSAVLVDGMTSVTLFEVPANGREQVCPGPKVGV